MRSRSTAGAGPRFLAPLACAALLATGCRGYYPSWHYAPAREVHVIHAAGEPEGSRRADVAVSIVGILRPADLAPRRVHVRFDVENPGPGPLTFKTMATTLTPAGALPLSPEEGADVSIASGERRTVELYFALPDPADLPNASLVDLELAWTLEDEGRSLTSRATFARSSRVRGDPYWHHPHGYVYFGPHAYWGPGAHIHWHGRFPVRYCD